MHASHATLLAVLLLATSTDDAAAQRNTGGCKGRVSNVIAANGGECPDNCFDTPAGQMIMTQGAPGTDWVVGITQCIKPSEAISFITWGPAGPNGECTAGCGDNKVEELPPGAPFTALTIPFGSCTGAPICVYVHDGTFSRGSEGVPLENVPESCISSDNQLCALCGAYLVTPTLSGGEGCSDEYTCTTGETCGAGGVCAGTPDNSLCNDNIACTGDVCVADQAPADVGVLPADVRADDSGCGHKATDVAADSCNDGFDCSGDLCVALPSVAVAVAGSPVPDANGCFFDVNNGPGCPAVSDCAMSECVAASPLAPGSGCVTSERSLDGVAFCGGQLPECVGAVCVDADGVTGYGEGTVDSAGCSLRPAADADAECPQPRDCGRGECNRVPRVIGGGCIIIGGSPFDAECDQGLTCEVGTCLGGLDSPERAGQCLYTPTDAICDDGKACTEDICVALNEPGPLGISLADVDSVTGCGYKEVAGVCDDTFSCSADLCVALPSVANAATTPAGAMGDDISGCFIDKETGPGCGDTPACASAVCVAGPPLVPGGPGCEITEIGNFCADKYGDCVGAVCSAADGVSAYADGTVDDDGCSIPSQSAANAACVAPLAPAVDCGGYTCSLAPGTGSGCVLSAGPASDVDCLDGLANCQTSTCSAEGACSAPTAIPGLCESKYEECAVATCAPGPTADADGCIVADEASANSACQADFPSACAPATCNRAVLPEGGTGTGLENSGCTRAPDVSLCEPDFPCQLPACSAEGVCSFTPSDELCRDPMLGFVPAGGFGPCLEAVCDPQALFDESGCRARAVDPSPCTLASDACGTSVCNMATGQCDVMSDVQDGQCGGCTTDCVDNVCVDGCNECQVCLGGACEARPNILAQPCTGPGGLETCTCSAEGECNFCRQECTFTGDTPADDVFRGCAETAEDPASSNCGSRCTELCRLKCGGTDTYNPNLCSNVMGGNCKGVFSVFDPADEFTGPCCKCDVVCP